MTRSSWCGASRSTTRSEGLLGRVLDHVRAVDDISFGCVTARRSTVGESGSARRPAGHPPPHRADRGRAIFDGQDIFRMGDGVEAPASPRPDRVPGPFGSLNPRMTVGDALREVLHVHRIARDRNDRRIHERSSRSALPDHARRYPHEFSGGQRQRIRLPCAGGQPSSSSATARSRPGCLRAGPVKLLADLQDRFGIAYSSSRDLSVVGTSATGSRSCTAGASSVNPDAIRSPNTIQASLPRCLSGTGTWALYAGRRRLMATRLPGRASAARWRGVRTTPVQSSGQGHGVHARGPCLDRKAPVTSRRASRADVSGSCP